MSLFTVQIVQKYRETAGDAFSPTMQNCHLATRVGKFLLHKDMVV